MRPDPKKLAIYFHWPFCLSKCPYCDFNAHAFENVDHDRHRAAYQKALTFYAEKLKGREVVSVFFGGGTPSLMKPEMVGALLSDIKKHWSVSSDIEITLEANPTSVEIEKFKAFRDAGVNRISLGIQSFIDKDLKFLGRAHDVAGAKKAIEIADQCFERYSFDLIYGRPDQSLSDWEVELKEALAFAKGHMSLYQLTIERSTPFYMRHSRGEFKVPDDVEGADFYHLTQDIMEEGGLPAYEVSNHSSQGQESCHNLVYWPYEDYIGIGAGAHGRFTLEGQKLAARDHSAPDIWLERAEEKGHGAHEWEVISPEDQFTESLMMGLRLKEGLSIPKLESKTSHSFKDQINPDHLQNTIKEGWVNYNGQNISLTREGLLRLNQIIPYLLG